MQHWGWGEHMKEDVKPFAPILTFLGDEETRTAFSVFGIALLLITAKVYYSIGMKDSEIHDEVRFLDEWALTFSEETTTLSESILLGDGDEMDVEFLIEETSFSEGYSIGYVQVKISYSETNQVIGGDPCDSVQGSLVQSAYSAQWADENNTLTGGSTSCEDIDLFLQTYPHYDGQEYTRMADNQVIALDEWGAEDYGVGSLDVKVQLDVQSSQIPTQDNDNDETIQIDVTVGAFKANAEKLT
jgi:hypothetical protein